MIVKLLEIYNNNKPSNYYKDWFSLESILF